MLNKRILTLIFAVAFLTLLIGCLPGITPSPPKGVIGGRIMAPPGPETTKDITGWIPLANATVTITDSEGVTHTATTDEDGYYTFTDIAVDANTIITAAGTVDGNTVIVKDVIPQAVAADEDYEAGIADAESTALALIVEELLKQGVDLGDIDLEGILGSDNFNEVVEQVNSILEENGNVTTDPGLTNTVGNVAEDIINPPEPTPEPTPPINHAPVINSSPVTTAVMGVVYLYDVEATDPDGDTLTYSLTTNPSGMTINSANGVIDWIPTAEGAFAVGVVVSDGALSDTQNFTITVKTVEIVGIVVLPEEMTLVTGVSETIQSVTALYDIKADFEVPIPLGDCTYGSDNPAVADVLVPGLITAFQDGIATITVSYAGESDTVEVTVVLPVHNITQDLYYNFIQSAVNDADPGDTIEVAEGMYNENITIDKANLTLQSEIELGAIIKPTSPGTDAIYISADGVTIDGFEINGTTLCKNGILGWETSGLTIKNNKIHGAVNAWDGCGILLFSWGTGGTVYDNLIENNEVYDTGRMGIMVMDKGANYSVTSNNTITGNTVYNVWTVTWGDHGGGIQINVAKDCAITNNEIYDVQNDQRGIYMFGAASGNTITGNTIRDNEIGIQLWISGEGSGDPIVWDGEIPTSPEVRYNNIYNNNLYGAISTNIQGTPMIMDATNNWWGSEFGATHNGFPVNGGDAVSDNVDYSNWSITSN